jgi:hypothetical protein
MKTAHLLTCIICLSAISLQAQTDWHITGNTGTTTGTNFLGTTDNKALMLKVNDQRSGYIDFAAAKGNTSFGYQALKNPSGNSNTAIGYKSMLSNTSGTANTSLGGYSLYFNTTGSGNVAVGLGSMYRTTNGHNNVAVGDSSLYDNTTGYFNTATGYLAMFRNIDGSQNTAYGFNALHFNTSGGQNTAAGVYALYNNTSGNFNTSFGAYALVDNTIGSENCVFGYGALNRNTTASGNVAVGARALYSQSYSAGGFEYATNNVAVGYEALYFNQPTSSLAGTSNTAIGSYALHTNTAGYYNTAVGRDALYSNTTADFNTAVGRDALYFNTADNNTATGADALGDNSSGNKNTADGNFALQFNTTGSQNTSVGYFSLHGSQSADGNTAVGYSAGYLQGNGYFNVFLGANSNVNVADYSNVIAIGQGTICTASNQVTIGNSSTTSYRVYAGWSNISDGRYKKNLKENVPGLQFINKLKPVTYTLDATGIDNLLHKNIPADRNESAEGKTVMQKATKEKEQIRYTGFVAQDVEKAAKELNYDFSGIDAAKNENDLYGLRYAEFVVPLVKAVQELSAIVDKQQKQIDELTALLISQNKENAIDTKQTASGK